MARMRITPDEVSRALSEKSSRPVRVKPLSSCRRMRTGEPWLAPPSRIYFNSTASEPSKTKWIGPPETMVVRTSPAEEPPATRLPGSTRRSETRPEVGAVTRVYSRFSWAVRTAALAAARLAWAASTAALLASYSARETAWEASRVSLRARLARARVSCDCIWATWAWAWARAAWAGRGSRVKSSWPFWTIWPSRKWTAWI